jgi:putative membrane protein
MLERRSHFALLLIFVSILVWSAIRPHDYFTWILEVFPALLAALLLISTGRRFPLTTLTYSLICVHAVILMVGGHYTYAEVPLGFWMRDAFHLVRNDYDRIGHFAQGFVPAMVAREVLLRKSVVRGRGWLYAVVVAMCLAISALYELLEWRVAVASGSASDAFLGTQGDPWDTQEDMATALVGAMLAPLLLWRLQDRQMSALSSKLSALSSKL